MVSYPNGQIDPEDYVRQRELDLQREVEAVEAAVGALQVQLTQAHRNLLNFIEHYWYQNQAYPSIAAMQRWAVEEGLDFTTCRQLELDLIGYLRQRGIAPSKANSRLSDEQLAAANLILNFADRRSKATKLKALGLTPTQWDGWLRQKNFKEYLNNRTGEMLDNNHDVANTGLLSAVERGEAQALKLYYEMTGIYKQDSPQANINVIMTLLIEVIQREVNDSDVLRRIAAGFELVMLRQATTLASGQPTALPEATTAKRAGHERIIDARDSALDRVNVRVANRNPPAENGLSALEF